LRIEPVSDHMTIRWGYFWFGSFLGWVVYDTLVRLFH
jgi:hypothetical protein